MAVTAVFFDVGETLVDEQRYWHLLADRLELQPHILWAAVGVTIAQNEEHTALWEHLGIERPNDDSLPAYERGDLYPDALPCLEGLRRRGYFVGIAGNQTATLENWARSESLPADVIASSARWGARKPEPAFFDRVIDACERPAAEIAYVGDRVDNDIVPALEAGLVAVHVRRGPWGYLQSGAERAHIQLDSLVELPEALAHV